MPNRCVSARNQLNGSVTKVTKGATASHVLVDLGNGQTFTSSITNESVDELGINVTVVVKLTEPRRAYQSIDAAVGVDCVFLRCVIDVPHRRGMAEIAEASLHNVNVTTSTSITHKQGVACILGALAR